MRGEGRVVIGEFFLSVGGEAFAYVDGKEMKGKGEAKRRWLPDQQ